MNASTRLQDIQISHAIALQRYGNGVATKIVKLLSAADSDLVAKIAERLSRIDERGYDLGPASTARLRDMLEELRVLNAQVYSRTRAELVEELEKLAGQEAGFHATALKTVVPFEIIARIPPTPLLVSIVQSRPFQGALLRDWVAGMEAGRRTRLEQAIRLGLVEGETIDQIVRRVRGTKKLGFKDGILEISRQSARTLVRTAVTHVSAQAREETYAANEDLIKGVQWVSTLDGRTSAVCRARDGKVFETGKGRRPPAHLGCRSTTIPILKSWRELGIDADEADEGIRASMDGALPAKTTYQDFLKRKPTSFQDEVLGKAKGEAFRRGLSLDRFVDVSGKEYTLDQLAALYPTFF